jgi:hypothetical protein
MSARTNALRLWWRYRHSCRATLHRVKSLLLQVQKALLRMHGASIILNASNVAIASSHASRASVLQMALQWANASTPKLPKTAALAAAVLPTLLRAPHSVRTGLGRGPVCYPVSVAEHLVPRMRGELDEDRPARHTEQLYADVNNCAT